MLRCISAAARPSLPATRALHGGGAAALYPATVESVQDVAGTDIRMLRVRVHEALAHSPACRHPPPPQPPPFGYSAGQWVDFHIPGVDAVGGYSMISAPSPLPPPLQRLLHSPALPVFDLAVKKASPPPPPSPAPSRLTMRINQARHAPAAWIHSLKCTPGAGVFVRVGGKFTLEPAMRAIDRAREEEANTKPLSAV